MNLSTRVNYCMRMTVTFCAILLLSVRFAAAKKSGDYPTQLKPDEFVTVHACGKLNSQVFAIGGETTGVTLTANGTVLELNLGSDAKLRQIADQLNGKEVEVRGELSIKRGVEIQFRNIVKVTSLKAAGGSKKASSFLGADGQLTHAITLRDAQGGFAGFSGHLWTIQRDGSWTRQPFSNRKMREPDQQGRLKKTQMAIIAQALTRYDVTGLPQRIGKDIGANPHVITLTIDENSSALTVQPGASLPPVDLDQVKLDPQDRFSTIVNLLLGEIGESK